jgi:CheY-like chemotaxis protein
MVIGDDGRDDEIVSVVDDDPVPGSQQAWRVLVVDDERDIFDATELAVEGLVVDGRPVALSYAGSAAQALDICRSDPEIAVVVLDVVMETESAGLDLVPLLRALDGREALRIVLRTGQPGHAPEIEVVRRYDIDDYRLKSELTHSRLISSLVSSIRCHARIRRMKDREAGLARISAARSDLLSSIVGRDDFLAAVVAQVAFVSGCVATAAALVRIGSGRSDVLWTSGCWPQGRLPRLAPSGAGGGISADCVATAETSSGLVLAVALSAMPDGSCVKDVLEPFLSGVSQCLAGAEAAGHL